MKTNTDVTYDWLLNKIQNREHEIKFDEALYLFLIVNNPFEILNIDWKNKTIFIKGLNVKFNIVDLDAKLH